LEPRQPPPGPQLGVRTQPHPIFERARFAVEEQLKLTEFVRDHRPQIYDLIAGGEPLLPAADSAVDSGGSMVAWVLPLAARVALAGSSEADFRRAVAWVRAALPAADPVSVLSALTLIYLAHHGQEEASADPHRVQLWQRIGWEIESLLESAAPECPSNGTERV
jgi:hypothetical protein